MPGVFTSRGCQACRKQKKACCAENDVPPCNRCKRLNIDCIGLGLRRFKFQDESDKVVSIQSARQNRKDETAITTYKDNTDSIPDSSDASKDCKTSTIFRAPSSALTRLTAAYMQGIDPHADVSVHLPWNFGPFLEDVPRHLGANKSLDAAADAVAAAYFCLRSQTRPSQDQHSLRKYSKALRSLAETLARPQIATASETLCAIKMLMIFESMAGFSSSGIIAHAGGAARIFKERGFTRPKNELEAKLMLSLRGPLVVQSIFLIHSYFTTAEWTGITESDIGSESPEEQSFRCFALYARLFQRARQLLAMQPSDGQVSYSAFASLEVETNDLRLKHAPFLQTLRERFWSLDASLYGGSEAVAASVAQITGQSPSALDEGSAYWTLKIMHAHIARSYGLGIACQIALNALILAIRAELTRADGTFLVTESESDKETQQPDKTLRVENAFMARETCQLVDAVCCHRPLGTIYVALILRIAYVGAGEVDLDGAQLHDDLIGNVYDPGSQSALSSNPKTIQDFPDLQPLSKALPIIGTKVEARIRHLLRMFVCDFETPGEEDEASADARSAAELSWLRDLFTLKLKEPTWVEQAQ